MLDMGFIPDIERIFGLTPLTRQTLFFSATMAPEIERITNTFLSAPARVEVARQATAGETSNSRSDVQALAPDREATEKRTLLRDLIEREGDKLRNAIIFCNRKVDVDRRQVDEEIRARRRADPWRSRPVAAHADARRLPRRDAEVPRRLRRGRARARHSRREPCLQLRRPRPRRGLRSPDRPHGRAGKTAPRSCSARPATKRTSRIEALLKQEIPRARSNPPRPRQAEAKPRRPKTPGLAVHRAGTTRPPRPPPRTPHARPGSRKAE